MEFGRAEDLPRSVGCVSLGRVSEVWDREDISTPKIEVGNTNAEWKTMQLLK